MNTDQDKKQEYVDYVRELHDRVSKKARDTGVTKWALVGALVYLFWQSIPLLSQARTHANWKELFVLFSAHISVILLTGFMCFGTLTSIRPVRSYDYRLYRKPEASSLLYLATIITLVLGVPLLLNIAAWQGVAGLSQLHYRLLSANGWMLLVVLLSASITLLQNQWKWGKTGFPPVAKLANDSKFDEWTSWLLAPVVFLAFGLNVYFTGCAFSSIDGKVSEITLTLGANAVFGIVGLLMILSSIPDNEALNRLSRIERDAIIHGLTADEIRVRIESDYLGHHFGRWLDEKIVEVRQTNAKWLAACRRHKEVEAELSSIDPAMIYERKGRMDAYIDEISSLSGELIKIWNPMSNWMLEAANRPGLDPHIRKLLSDAHEELSCLVKDTRQEAEATLQAIRKGLLA